MMYLTMMYIERKVRMYSCKRKLMKKIAIVSDSGISFTEEEVKHFDVYIAPLTVTHNNKTYEDQITITNEDMHELLRNKEAMSTSQPNLGKMMELLEEIKTKDYDYTIVLAMGTALSGTYPTFVHAAKETGIENCTVFNTQSISGPPQQAVRAIRYMNEHGKSINEILEYLYYLFDHQVSYLYPKTLERVVLSGRMSKTASKIVSLLKVKPVLHLEVGDESIETLGIARTDKKNFQSVVNSFIKHNVLPETHDVYLMESEGMDRLESFKTYLTDKIGDFKYYIITLPAAVAIHGGLGTIAIQFAPKFIGFVTPEEYKIK